MDTTIRTQKQLGTELRRSRKKQKLSQVALGSSIKKRQATISSLESEGNGTLETLFAVLSALELELVLRPRSKAQRRKIEDVF